MATQTTSIDIKGYTTKDMAYAAMGLLSYRLIPNDSDNVFQAIARLFIINDSNQLLERLLCLSLFPEKPPVETPSGSGSTGNETILCNIADEDQYCTHLWDIKPLCDVVGIGDDLYEPTVIEKPNTVDATITVDITTQLNVISIANTLLEYYLLAIALYFGVAWIISLFSPWAVRKLCSNRDMESPNHLVGFEGTMRLRELEKIIYGNFNNRLSHAASSTVFSRTLRDTELRMSREPNEPERGEPSYWETEVKKLGLPNTHRIFTLVNTGNMTVSVISAERPPVVALLCGREGGMLRVLLCSWRFENNCLCRQGVIRMRSSLEEQATRNDWLKISLASQGDVNHTRVSEKAKERQAPTSYPSPPRL
ncbi:hypothetical protein PENVUL_c012G08894 [Penicillium vulpinum]|uniref:Uncharacterized protein n=2 Tax=Penicillium vulpinum TaxID=29845 RepID=A0A1V6S125_9EURO|nr:hypothetical protein PENVUL_c012G08894 [Penicillium vulpinum]